MSLEKTIYYILLIALFVISILVFLALFFISAPYGRFTRRGWGLRINPRIAWFIMEIPAFGTIIVLYGIGNKQGSIVAAAFLFLWLLHYIQRTFIYPFFIKTSKNTFPVLIIVFSIVFNVINGYLNGRYLFYFSDVYPVSWFYDPRFIIGTAIFIAGFIININSDSILRNLRDTDGNGYKIPYGGFFKYISSPNYFGEMMEWIGWAILTWSIPGLAFAAFTIANLAPRAISNHKWYKKHFPDYPVKRKAIIPFIY